MNTEDIRKMNVERTLKTAFSEGLGVSLDETDWSALTYRGIPEWDSVAHMQVIAEIEDAFDIMLEIDDVTGMSSFEIAKDILTKYDLSFS
jgi:acyl carrier protein